MITTDARSSEGSVLAAAVVRQTAAAVVATATVQWELSGLRRWVTTDSSAMDGTTVASAMTATISASRPSVRARGCPGSRVGAQQIQSRALPRPAATGGSPARKRQCGQAADAGERNQRHSPGRQPVQESRADGSEDDKAGQRDRPADHSRGLRPPVEPSREVCVVAPSGPLMSTTAAVKTPKGTWMMWKPSVNTIIWRKPLRVGCRRRDYLLPRPCTFTSRWGPRPGLRSRRAHSVPGRRQPPPLRR